MTAQPARIDLADLGPGVAWAFEFDENGRGRLLGGDSSIDLTARASICLGALDLGKRADTRVDRRAGRPSSRGPRGVFIQGSPSEPALGRGSPVGNAPRRPPRRPKAGMEATDLRFALWPQFLLTARHHAARSAMAVKDQAEKGATFEDSAALFESMLIAAADSIGEAAQQIAGRARSDRRPRFVGRLE